MSDGKSHSYEPEGRPRLRRSPKSTADSRHEHSDRQDGIVGSIFRGDMRDCEMLTDLWFRSSAVIGYPVGSLCFLLWRSTWFFLLLGSYCSEIVPKPGLFSSLRVGCANPL